MAGTVQRGDAEEEESSTFFFSLLRLTVAFSYCLGTGLQGPGGERIGFK